MTQREIIAEAYNLGVDEEYHRLVSNPLFEAEYVLITELMERYIAPNSVVYDIGAGPGRYAEFLLKKNCKVGLVDLSIASLKAFNQRLDEKNKVNLLFTETACATDLSFIKSNTADAVLLMGPLYHLTECEERTKAIAEAFRVLKDGGVLFAVFMSTHAHQHGNEGASHHHHGDNQALCCSDYVKHLLKDSISTIIFQGYHVPQYRCLPDIAIESIEPHGFGTMHIRNIEGLGITYTEESLKNINDDKSRIELIEALRQKCEIEDLKGLAHQFLYVGRKSISN